MEISLAMYDGEQNEKDPGRTLYSSSHSVLQVDASRSGLTAQVIGRTAECDRGEAGSLSGCGRPLTMRNPAALRESAAPINRKVATMNWNQVEGNWRQVKGKVEETWGRLTADELYRVAGKRDMIVGHIQAKYGIVHEEADWIVLAFFPVGPATSRPRKLGGQGEGRVAMR